jgi:predicted GH43/DUF377 family glycosyl hydrolase
MIPRLSEKLLLRPEDLKPLHDDFAVIGVFNPGVVKVNDEIVMLARVAEKPLEMRPGFVGLPRWGKDGEVAVDWVAEAELDQADPRLVRRKSDDLVRLTSISHLQVFRSRDECASAWTPGAVLLPESSTEEFGIEDPRITELDGKHWITYVAVSRLGAATALAATRDWTTFERHGVIFCPENKDVALFPRQVHGQYAALHRPNPNTQFDRPRIWLARSPNLLYWGKYEFLHRGNAVWESDRVGAGAPPIEIEEGWLEIYHGSRRAAHAGEVGAYSAGALLLDRGNPARVLRRSHEPIMRPMADFERAGCVPDVVFPTAVIQRDETLLVYYGASDTFVGVVELSRKELLAALR